MLTGAARLTFFFLGAGLIGAIFALAIPDPNVPIKRIHVAEYVILAFFVRYTLSHRLTGLSLTIFTALIAILYGVHDEMLQGFHSLRYFGWRDIIVNGMAGISGAFLGHALFCFDRTTQVRVTSAGEKVTPGLFVLLVFLYGAVTVLVAALYQQRGAVVSLYPLVPLAAICILIVFFYPDAVLSSRKNHGVQAVFWLGLLLLLYPLITRFASVDFV